MVPFGHENDLNAVLDVPDHEIARESLALKQSADLQEAGCLRFFLKFNFPYGVVAVLDFKKIHF